MHGRFAKPHKKITIIIIDAATITVITIDQSMMPQQCLALHSPWTCLHLQANTVRGPCGTKLIGPYNVFSGTPLDIAIKTPNKYNIQYTILIFVQCSKYI